MNRLLAALLACALYSVPALAQPVGCVPDNNGRVVCGQGGERIQPGPRAKASVSRACLTPDTRAVLNQAEDHFGVKFRIVSTCRPGARIAGTRHISQHARGRAVDLIVPRSIAKAAVVRWFYEHAKGVTMVYRGMAHVHFDTGPYHALACGGCRKHHRVASQ